MDPRVLPAVQSDWTSSRRVRYICASGTSSTSVTRADLLNVLFFNTAGTTTNYRLCTAVRLKRLHVWTIGNNFGVVATTSVEWLSESGPAKLVSDSSIGVSMPGYFTTAPPKDSLAGYWSLDGTNESTILFNVILPADSVVDAEFEVVMQNFIGVKAPTAVTTSNNGTVGTLYTGFLDGVGSGKIAPLSSISLQ